MRHLAKGTGTLAKNDRLDSFNHALFAQVVRPAPRERGRERQGELDALVTRRRGSAIGLPLFGSTRDMYGE